MKNWVLIEKDLYSMWNNFYIEYASVYADEPWCELSMKEIEYILDNTVFSKNRIYNNCVKLIIRLHCIGVSDFAISKGLKKLGQDVDVNTLKQIRFKAGKKVEEKFGENIGIITILYETFHDIGHYEK